VTAVCVPLYVPFTDVDLIIKLIGHKCATTYIDIVYNIILLPLYKARLYKDHIDFVSGVSKDSIKGMVCGYLGH
jgi:hypothetical protein